MSWLNSLRRWLSGRDSVSSPEIFRSRLLKERALADRNGHRFSLVTLKFPAPLRATEGPIRVIEKEIRLSDEIGWIAPNCLGLILPQTPASGARLVADRIQVQLRDLGLDPGCQVSEYPRDGLIESFAGTSEKESEWALEAAEAEPGAAFAKQEANSEIDLLLGISRSRLKRAFDVVGSSLLLLFLSPFLLLVAAWIKICSPEGPVFFVQERVGLNGRRFNILKFRTMRAGSCSKVHTEHFHELVSSDKPMTKLDDLGDSRLLPLSNLLRRSAIDELPQLINVLQGDMSLVGPRPCLAYEVRGYQLWHLRRFDTLPGMTGLWQVSGKNRTTFTEMIRQDISYAKRPSLPRDLGILLKTPNAVYTQVIEGYRKRFAKMN